MRYKTMVILASLLLIGCKRDEMADQPKAKPLRPTEFFADGSTARQPVPGTIARGQLEIYKDRLASGSVETAANAPFPLTYDDLKRGQERFDIYCAVCHGRTGEGDGMIVQRGFTQPPAYFPLEAHRTQYPDLYAREAALMNQPLGHFVNVMTTGYGAMYSYADRVKMDDRWRIAGYIRALQLSRGVKPSELSDQDRAHIAIASETATTQPAEANKQ